MIGKVTIGLTLDAGGGGEKTVTLAAKVFVMAGPARLGGLAEPNLYQLTSALREALEQVHFTLDRYAADGLLQALNAEAPA